MPRQQFLYIGNFGVHIRRCIGNLYFVYKLFDNSDQFYTSHLHDLLSFLHLSNLSILPKRLLLEIGLLSCVDVFY